MENYPLNDITNRMEGILAKEVIKRDASRQPMDLKKIHNRLANLLDGLEAKYLDLKLVLSKVADYAQNGNPISNCCRDKDH